MREVLAASFANVLIFAALVGTPTVAHESDEKLAHMFGAHPFGIPVRGLVFLVLAVLYLPLIPAIAGLVRVGLTGQEMKRAAESQDWDYYRRMAAYRPGRFGSLCSDLPTSSLDARRGLSWPTSTAGNAW